MKGGPDSLLETGERILVWFWAVKYEWISNLTAICSHKACMLLSYSTFTQDTIIQHVTGNHFREHKFTLVLLNIPSNVFYNVPSYLKEIMIITSTNGKMSCPKCQSNQSLHQWDAFLGKMSVFLSALTERFKTRHINEQFSF